MVRCRKECSLLEHLSCGERGRNEDGTRTERGRNEDGEEGNMKKRDLGWSIEDTHRWRACACGIWKADVGHRMISRAIDKSTCGRMGGKDVHYPLTGWLLANDTSHMVVHLTDPTQQICLQQSIYFLMHHRLLRTIITAQISRNRIPPRFGLDSNLRTCLDLRPHGSISCFLFDLATICHRMALMRLRFVC